MLEYIQKIQKMFVTHYNFAPHPAFPNIPAGPVPDGHYPMVIDGRTDHVQIINGKISCGNPTPPPLPVVEATAPQSLNEIVDSAIAAVERCKSADSIDLPEVLKTVEMALIELALRKHRNNQGLAAKFLGIPRTTLQSKFKAHHRKLGVSTSKFRSTVV